MVNEIIIPKGITLLIALIGVAITFGVVLRTGKRLALSYKYFLSAIIAFAAAELAELLTGLQIISPGLGGILMGSLEVAFVVLFVGGAWNMRACIKAADNKIKKSNV